MKILRIFLFTIVIGISHGGLTSDQMDLLPNQGEARPCSSAILHWKGLFLSSEEVYKVSSLIIHNRTAYPLEMGDITLPPKKSFNFEIRHLQENEPRFTLEGTQLLFKTSNALEPLSFTHMVACAPTQPLTVVLREIRMPKGENLLVLGRHGVGRTPAPLENRWPLGPRVVKHASLPTRGGALKALILVEERRH